MECVVSFFDYCWDVTSFWCLLAAWICFPSLLPIQIFCLYVGLLVFFSLTVEVLYIFWIQMLCLLYALQIFLPRQWDAFSLFWCTVSCSWIYHLSFMMCFLCLSHFEVKDILSFQRLKFCFLTFRLLTYL